MTTPIQLAAAAENAVRACRVEKNPVKGSGEVAEVARLVLQLPEKLVREWKKHLKTGEIDVIGVFSHKTPKTSWTGSLDKRTRRPELCDLLLVFDCEESGGRTQRALMIQAKVADPGAKTGQFTVAKNGEDAQRYLYAHLPPFTLTGLRPKPLAFDIAPLQKGACLGTRYACINVHCALPSSGWWLEAAQPAVPANPAKLAGYAGTYNAKVPLGQALRDMLAGRLGEVLTLGSEWRRLVDHLMSVAERRQKNGKGPPDVVGTASGTLLPHMARASLFLAHASQFFEEKATSGYGAGHLGSIEPPTSEGTTLILDGASPGFGIIYVRVISPVWRTD